MQHRKGLLVGLLALGALATSSHAQSIRPLMHVGDTIIGMGALDGLITLAINNSSMWVMEVDTDFSSNTEDGALLRNGFVTLREGLSLFQPPNATHNEFIDLTLAENGELGLLMSFADAGVNRNGVFWNLVPLAATGDAFPQHPTETNLVWNTLQHAKMNNNREFLVFGELSPPGVNLGKRHTLVKYQVNAQGAVTSLELLASKGLPIEGLAGDTMNVMPTNLGATAMNDHGDFICVIDGQIGTPAVMVNLETVVAQQGSPAPNGIEWKWLDRVPRVNINDFGDYVFAGSTIIPGDPNADDGVYTMIRGKGGDTEIFAQEGQLIGPFVTPMGKGSTHQIIVTNGGDVFWYWQNLVGGASSQFALMRNYVPIIESNVTRIGTNLVQDIPTQDSFHVSRNGRFFLTRVTVATLGETLLLMDFGSVVPIPGCSGNPGKLRLVDGLALPGYDMEGPGEASLVLGMDNGQAAGVRPVLFFSTRERIPGSPCGSNTEWGELLISMGHRFGKVTLPTWDGTQESLVNLPIPNDLSLVNAVVFAQGAFIDVNHTAAEDFRFTNALRMEIGAP